MLVITSLYSEQNASKSSPFELHIPIPCKPITLSQLFCSHPSLALKSPAIMSGRDLLHGSSQFVIKFFFVLFRVCPCWSIGTDNCIIDVSLQRQLCGDDSVIDWCWFLFQSLND